MIFSLATQVTLTFKSEKKKFLCENVTFPIAVKGEWVDQTCMDTTISKQTLLSCPKMLTIGPACLLLRGGGVMVCWVCRILSRPVCTCLFFVCLLVCFLLSFWPLFTPGSPLTHLFPPSYITVYTLYTVYIQFIYTVYFLWHMPVLVQSSWELYSFT